MGDDRYHIILDDHVMDFINGLSTAEQVRSIRGLELLEEFGPNLREPHAKHIRGKLRELRYKYNRKNFRFFYYRIDKTNFKILHAIVKKTNKTPESDIKIALSRIK